MLAIGIGSAGATPPIGRQIDVSSASGCCICRGNVDGVPGAIKSCADGKTVDGCVAKCSGEGASSIGFGYQQTCSQGCAGFPTQGK